MQYTPHYNLNLPEGTDIVNPLVQDNPNYTAIDTAMYANKLRVIGTATELASGSVHALTRSDTDIDAFKFVATADFNIGDTFTVDGVSVTARRADGATMKNKAYVINSTVFCILDGTILNFIGVDGVIDAADVPYDNTSSGLVATDVQNAVDEIAEKNIITLGTTSTSEYTFDAANCVVINGIAIVNLVIHQRTSQPSGSEYTVGVTGGVRPKFDCNTIAYTAVGAPIKIRWDSSGVLHITNVGSNSLSVDWTYGASFIFAVRD